ncbi:MAG TPA: DUF3035 domain-containing protein [Rhizomicrobium sp.]|jgi:hypothetical protein
MKPVRNVLRFAALAGLALSLIGCESIRQAAGVTKEPPDEFAVVTKSPLVIPPDFELKPPKPGAVPTNQSSPTDAAQAALFGDDPAAAAAAISGNYSPAERTVLANSGGASADHGIRKQIAADTKSMEATDDSFTDELLFGSPDTDNGKPLDADAEAQRISAAKAQGKATLADANSKPGGEPPARKPQDSATVQRDGSDKKSDSGGWFDWLF